MTQSEKAMFEKLQQTMDNLNNQNQEYRAMLTERVDKLDKHVSEKHMPVSLEYQIMDQVGPAINKAIKDSLSGYNSPLASLTALVVNEHHDELKEIVTDAFEDVIRVDEFKSSVREAFSHKVSRTIISNNGGLFDKVANELKQDAQFKAKITLAIANIVNELLNERAK